jgi:hypothetical protein
MTRKRDIAQVEGGVEVGVPDVLGIENATGRQSGPVEVQNRLEVRRTRLGRADVHKHAALVAHRVVPPLSRDEDKPVRS